MTRSSLGRGGGERPFRGSLDSGLDGFPHRAMAVGSRRIHQLPVTTASELDVTLAGDGRLVSARLYTGALNAGIPAIPDGYEAPTDAPE